MPKTQTNKAKMTNLTDKLLTARSEADVASVLEAAAALGISGSRVIGGGESNAGPIEGSSAPHSALIERATNGIDAVLERRARIAGYRTIEDWPNPPSGPREAARVLFDLPRAGLGDLTDGERRELAENLVFMLDESGIKDHPTVIVEDKGIGQTVAEMPNGLLSLNKGNKAQKPWQSGAYGQGGSATLRFCPYTIFVSRKDSALLEPGETDTVAWTIAYRDEGDPYKDALPVYRHLTGPDEVVPSFDPSLLPDEDWSGTRIVHIAYDLSRYATAFTQLQKSLWVLFNSYLFDPVLPFLIGGRRQVDLDSVKKGMTAAATMSPLAVAPGDITRPISGNRYRLDDIPANADIEPAWKNSVTRDLSAAYGKDLGTLRVNYWVLRRPDDSSSTSSPVESYVSKDSAVTITLNGQRHDAESRTWLTNRLKLPYLKNNLIVQIDIDNISPPAKRELFTSTREQMVDQEMKTVIYEEAIGLLKEDEQLRLVNREMRDRELKKGARVVGDKLRQKLARYVDTFLRDQKDKVEVDGGKPERVGPPPRPPGPPSPPRATDDQHLPNVPTDMRFDRDPISITQGKRTTVWLHVDAKNGYLDRHADELSVRFTSDLANKVHEVGKSTLIAGKSRWTLFAEDDAPLGDGEMEVLLITTNGLIRTTVAIRVLAPPKTTTRKQSEKEVPLKGPNIEWVERDQWNADFTEMTVGVVAFGDEDTDIRVNRNHPLLEAALRQDRLNKEQIDAKAEKYLFAMACGLFKQGYAVREVTTPPTEDHQAEERERLAEAVLIAIDDKMVELAD